MTKRPTYFQGSDNRYSIWIVGVSFVLIQFFVQMSSGVVMDSIMQTMALSGFTAGLLGSAIYLVYALVQLPVGVLFDRYNTRTLMAGSAFVCGAGCVFFSQSVSIYALFVTRFIIGAGAGFAFVGLSHILREHFPLRQFPFMIGLSETLAFLVTVAGMIGMGAMLSRWGWHAFIEGAGVAAMLTGYLSWRIIPDSKPSDLGETHYKQQLIEILKNPRAWINGLFVGLGFTLITVFAGMWSVPFMKVKLGCSLGEATFLGAMVFLGACIGCPLFGLLSIRLERRRPMILLSCVMTTILVLVVLFAPIHQFSTMAWLMGLIGLVCGSYMLAYSIANEIAPANSMSTCTGFTNTLAVLGAPLMQPVVGYLLDVFSVDGVYTVGSYQMALLLIPGSLLLAGGLVFFLPEKA